MSTLTIRAARLDDVPAMRAIRLRVSENRLSSPGLDTEAEFRGRLKRGDGSWVAERDGAIVGYAMVDPTTRSVWALCVAPEHEGQGIGRALEAAMLNEVLTTWIRVTLAMEPGPRSERFFRESGWVSSGKSGAPGKRVLEKTRWVHFGED